MFLAHSLFRVHALQQPISGRALAPCCCTCEIIHVHVRAVSHSAQLFAQLSLPEPLPYQLPLERLSTNMLPHMAEQRVGVPFIS